jgi:hypothetical protein
MDTYHVVLYLHLMSLFVLVGGITLVGVCYARLRAAASLIEATPWATLADQAGWIFPPAILGLLATGAYLTNDMWTWGTPWIAVSVAGLVLVTLQGPLVAGTRAKALTHALEENPAGPLDLRARQLARDRTLWIVIFANPGVVLGITWNMSVKPGTVEAIAAVLVGYAIGAAAALPLTKQPSAGDPKQA